MSDLRKMKFDSSLVIFAACVCLFFGCDATRPQVETKIEPTGAEPANANHIDIAKQLLAEKQLDRASETIRQLLIAEPENNEALLVAGEIASARGKPQVAIDFVKAIDLGSPQGFPAVLIHAAQLVKLKRHPEAADVLIEGAVAMPRQWELRHRAWSLLNQLGRREEASLWAHSLCRYQQATESELVSLLQRNDAYPFTLKVNEKPESFFLPGSGLARWYFSQREFAHALEELGGESRKAFSSESVRAFHGRLLAETQTHDRLPQWYVGCNSETARFSDFWAALGIYFFDNHQYEASARALMEAIARDPTDDLTAHRLANVFDSLSRHDDSEQFRERAIQVVELERHANELSLSLDSPLRRELPQRLLKLGRPFEALNWSLFNLPSDAVAARNAMAGQLVSLNGDAKTLAMASEMALVEIDRETFSIQSSLEELKQLGASGVDSSRPPTAPLLAKAELVDVAQSVGLAFQWYVDETIDLSAIPIHEVMGGGIAAVDFDLDGWPDVYLGQGSGDPPQTAGTRSSELFRNLSGQFASVTKESLTVDFGYSAGIAVGDVNQDGFPDLLLGIIGKNRLLINQGDGTFYDASSRLNQGDGLFTSSVAIADMDGDHVPDLIECTYLRMDGAFQLPVVGKDGKPTMPSPLSFHGEFDRWLQNDGRLSFTPNRLEEGVDDPGTGLGIIVADFNADGRNEIFVANDGRQNHFHVVGADGRISNIAGATGLAAGFGGDANACMGIATGDFNRDGSVDMHITNFSEESSNLFLQRDGSGFTDFATRYSIDVPTRPLVGFGTKAIDIDRNGWLDLIISNGHVFDQRGRGDAFAMPPQLLLSDGRTFVESDIEDASGYCSGRYLGRAVTRLDFNQDHSLDFLVGHLDAPLALLENRTATTGNWLQLELVGTTSERDAIGARVAITVGNDRYVDWVTAGDGYLSSDEAVVDLGIGRTATVARLEITWPSGAVQSFQSVPTNRRYLAIEGIPTLDLRN